MCFRFSHRVHAVVSSLVLMACVSRADAAGGLILIEAPPQDSYSLSVGPGIAGYPRRAGSGRVKVLGVPGIDFYASSGIFASTDIGVGWNGSRTQDTAFGVRLWPVFGRSGASENQLGLTNFGTRLGKGAFLNYAPWPFLILQSGVLAGSGRTGKGVQFETGATVGAPVGDRLLLGVTAGTTWSNAAYTRSYYGVTPRESARGVLPVYSPGAGLSDGYLQLSGEARLANRWKLSGEWIEARLVGDSGRSPVVRARFQPTFSLTLWYEIK